VLTGDKIETAVQIGQSTGLLNEQIAQHFVIGETFREISMELADVADVLHSKRKDQ